MLKEAERLTENTLVVLFICRPVDTRDGLAARVSDEFFGGLEMT